MVVCTAVNGSGCRIASNSVERGVDNDIEKSKQLIKS